VTASLKHLAKLGIARETIWRNHGRIYAYDKHLTISMKELNRCIETAARTLAA
jgi:hypothetical protein